MLDEKRIKEAQNNVRRYLEEGLINSVDKVDENVSKILLHNCYESLKVSELLFGGNH